MEFYTQAKYQSRICRVQYLRALWGRIIREDYCSIEENNSLKIFQTCCVSLTDSKQGEIA